MKVYQCQFDDEVTVVEVSKEDAEYAQAKEVFDKGTIAFTVLNAGISAMVIDAEATKEDWFTDEHMSIIQAHEVAHLLNGSEDELEADLTGLQIIGEQGTIKAFQLYCSEIQARYCSSV